MELQFKKCEKKDIEELLYISRKTFIDAFEKDNDPEDFKTYIDFAFDEMKIKSELENPNSSFYFSFLDEALVGYFKLNENDAQTDIKNKNNVELERIYVLNDFQGRKIGQKLLRHAVKLGAEKGKEYIWLGVWEKNVDAIRFYQKHGFAKFGTHPYYIGNDKQTDWLMRYDLSNFQ
jgi:ribosomal protein S18 acetylase RimI-like enzyme